MLRKVDATFVIDFPHSSKILLFLQKKPILHFINSERIIYNAGFAEKFYDWREFSSIQADDYSCSITNFPL